jgi:hypothetical protein
MAIVKNIGGNNLIVKINQADAGFLSITYVGKAAENWTHTAGPDDFYFECDPREQAVVITLPSNATSQGAVYVFKNILAGFGTQITPATDDWIDDAQNTAVTMSSNGESVMLIAGPGRWRSIAHMTSNA